MTAPPDDHVQLVAELFKSTLEIDPQDRQSFLDEQCRSNPTLRAEIESLLQTHNRAEKFMERSAIDFAAQKFAYTGAFAPGQIVDNYEIISLIGIGGMGEVYLAQDRQLHRCVALKLIRRGMDTDLVVRRFHHEQQILAGLNHPNIAQLYDAGVTPDGIPFFALENVEGTRIDDYCREKNLTIQQRLELFGEVCAAVHYAHQHLIVHRDIKPSNILVTADGEPKLLDFGIAKMLDAVTNIAPDQTITLQKAMTPEYASPEHVRGEPITTASDVYSLGVLLYELLTETKPYKIDNRAPIEIARVITEREPTKPSAVAENQKSKIRNQKSLRGDLDNIVLMAMRKEPQRRYSSVAQFAADIRRHLEGLPVRARKDTFAYRSSKFVRRNRVAVIGASFIFATLVTGIVTTAIEKRRADRRFNDVRQMAHSFIFDADDEIQKGPTNARAMLVGQALRYLDSLAKESGNDAGLQLELAISYLKIGDIQGKPHRPNLGNTAGALGSYKKAEALLESLIKAAPGNLEARRYLSVAWQSAARVQGRDGDWAMALASQRKAVAISEALVSVDLNNATYRGLLADNYLHLGEALYQAERGATVADHLEAITYFRKALAIHDALAAANPANADYRYAKGVDYEFVGIAFNKLGDLTGDAANYRAALDNHREELKVNEALAASDPGNGRYRRILADVYGEIGLSHLKLGNTAEALEDFRRKVAIFESIKASDPTNVEAQLDVALAYHEVGQALAQSGDSGGAITEERKAVAILQSLRDAEPNNTETSMNLLRSLEALAQGLERTRDFAGASENYRRAKALLVARSNLEPDNVLIQRLLAAEKANVERADEAQHGGKEVSR